MTRRESPVGREGTGRGFEVGGGLLTRVRNARLPRGGRLFGPLFGLLFLAYPVGALLAAEAPLARLFAALAGTSLFVGIFLWLLWLHEPLRVTTEFSDARGRRVAVASLVALALALTSVCGEEWLILFVHAGVAAGLMLPGKDVPAAVGGMAILMAAVGRLSGADWAAIGRFALPMAALGFLMAALARHVVTVAELREAQREIARLAVAEERLRFARDLHDLLGHSLSSIALKSELAGRLLPAAPERAAAEVRDVEGVARRALREVREAVAGYRRPTLDEELAGAREMLGAAGIVCRVERGAGDLPPATDAVLAWAVREGVTNVIRHSRAERCEIRVTQEDRTVRVEVRDDGRGRPPERPENGAAPGSGLSGLAERVAAGGGDIEAGPLPGGGFRLSARLPVRGDEGAP